MAGFLSGSSLRISRKAASSAIAWTVYEGLLLVLHSQQAAAAGGAQQKLA
jgi:solute carrier family 25 protein 38